MENSKIFRPYSYFLFLLPFFVSVCILFTFIGNSFCKEEPTYAATKPQSKQSLTLIIDAGHGGEDGGAVGANGEFEKDLNLKIAFMRRDMALSSGYDTVMTRTEDILLYDRNVDYKGRKKALDLLARVKIAEKYENALFVSIHMNAFPEKQYSFRGDSKGDPRRRAPIASKQQQPKNKTRGLKHLSA